MRTAKCATVKKIKTGREKSIILECIENDTKGMKNEIIHNY
jgi:hypothetical protein